MTTIASLALAVLAATASGTDTTLSVREGTRLELDNFSGGIVVETWARNAVRIRAEHSRRTEVEVDHEGTVLSVSASGHMGTPATVDYLLTVPSWMALELSGIGTDVTVRGTRGSVSVETVKGDVSIEGGSGRVSATSIEGGVHVEATTGNVEVSSVNEGVWVSGVSGPISASSVNGHVVLTSVQSTRVDASTVNGTVLLTGPMRPDGVYHLSSHNGDLLVGIAAQANVSVHVSTYQGELKTGFPVKMSDTRKEGRYRFTLGSGAATLELESFQGTITVDRPGVVDRAAEELRREYGFGAGATSSSGRAAGGKGASGGKTTTKSKSTSHDHDDDEE